MSPAAMYSFAVFTISRKRSRGTFDFTSMLLPGLGCGCDKSRRSSRSRKSIFVHAN